MSAILSTKSRAFYVAGQNIGTITQTCLSFDDSLDVTVATPTSPDCIYLLSWIYSETAAHTVTFKSGSDIICELPFGSAASLLSGYVNTGFLLTGPGEALKAALSVTGKMTTVHTTSHEIAAAFFRKVV